MSWEIGKVEGRIGVDKVIENLRDRSRWIIRKK
jgi:hypothetical protein